MLLCISIFNTSELKYIDLRLVYSFIFQDVSEEPNLAASPESQDSDTLGNPSWKLLTNFILQKHADHVVNIERAMRNGSIVLWCCSFVLIWFAAFFIEGRSPFCCRWSCVNISSVIRHTQQSYCKSHRNQWVNSFSQQWVHRLPT